MLLQGALACQDCKGLKFAYALQKNIRLIKQEMNRLFDIMKPSEEFNEYDKEREKLAEKFAKKDKDGKPVIKDDKYVIPKRKQFDKELEELQEKYAKPFKEQEEKNALFNEKLEEECTIKFHKISEKDLPENMSARELDIVSSFMYDKESSDMVEKKREEHKLSKTKK